MKGKNYFEQSGRLGHSKALLKLGNIYENGTFVKQNYNIAVRYYEQAYQHNNPDALFFLGSLFSDCDEFDIDIQRAIDYYFKSIQTHYDTALFYNYADRYYTFKTIYNHYYYQSNNNLGLIYLTIFQDFEKASEYIKEAGLNEYPFGQNNYGLFYQIYYNNIYNAEYFYERASKNNFVLAEYNLGFLNEKKGKLEKSIFYYKKASENEDSQLIYRNCKINDKRLELSKTFIICLTNLKLIVHYFTLSNYDKSKRHFIRALRKLEVDSNQVTLLIKKPENLFLYLKNFILNSPLFNLINQPDLTSSIKGTLEKISILDKKRQRLSQLLKNNNFVDGRNKIKDKNKNVYYKIVFHNSDELFDYIISNSEYNNIFIKEIQSIIEIMMEIIYTPPYSILFGRMSFKKPKLEKNEYKKNLPNINELFYEGLDLDEFRHINH